MLLKLSLALIVHITCLAGLLFCQDVISVSFEDDVVTFKTSASRKIYFLGDTLKIHLEILNKSGERIMIQDVEKNYPNLMVTTERHELSYDIGGPFDPNTGLWYKLKILEPNSSVTYDFEVVLIEEKGIRLDRNPQAFKFFITTGYFTYDPGLRYLAETDIKCVSFKSEEDLLLAARLSKDVFLGYLPVSIGKN